MPQAVVFSADGERIGEMSLPESIFGREVNKALVRAAVLAHLAAARVGTVGVKTRSEVSGGGRKPWRQKGTGRARQGSIRSPLWRHGGVVFGPVARDYSWRLTKKMKRNALLSALSDKAQNNRVFVISDLKIETPKTKRMYELLKKIGAEKSALVVTAQRDPNVILSCRNIPGVKVVTAQELNTYDTMAKKYVLLTDDAVKTLEEALS